MNDSAPGVRKIYRRDNQPFAQIPNEAIRSPEITANGFRLLAYLMSHQDGYELTYSQIERETGLGRYAINEAIKNLETLGWLATERTKMPNGQYGPKSWTVLTPTSASFSTVGDSTVEQPTDIRRTLPIEDQEKRRVNAQDELERQFLLWWSFYPRKTGKVAAFKAYAKAAHEVGYKTLFDGVERLAADPNLPAKNFIPHPATWLNEGRWDDEPYPERILTPEEAEERRRQAVEAKREAERRASEALRAEWAKAEAEAAPAPKCVHGHNIALCLPCIRANNVGSTD
jgi:predicted transcriptional regulator